MASNTKFLGFGPHGVVQLERWGQKADARLPTEAIKELRRICYEVLPKQPPERMGGLHPDEFAASYDESMGRVHLSLSPDMAFKMASFLTVACNDMPAVPDVLEIREWAAELIRCHQAHRDYLDLDEPGVRK